jgi:hypothetical protein
VRNHNNTATAELEIQAEPSQPIQAPWHREVGQFLTHAAELCVEHGVDLDNFMRGAWSAYVEARPGMRDYLEEMQLRDQLDEIRKSGQMGEA